MKKNLIISSAMIVSIVAIISFFSNYSYDGTAEQGAGQAIIKPQAERTLDPEAIESLDGSEAIYVDEDGKTHTLILKSINPGMESNGSEHAVGIITQ